MLASIIKKEIMLEFRQKSALGGVLVYVTGTIFITAMCFKGRKLDIPAWNALFWVITLFTSVSISSRSFLKESGGAALYNYLHYSAYRFVIAKSLYNMLFMLALSLVTFCFYSFFLQPVFPSGESQINTPLFLLVLALASTGMSSVLTLMSAIASKANGGFALMSILSFPVILPLIMVVIRLSKQAVDGLEWAGVSGSLLMILVSLNVLTLALAFLLFPYLWRE